MDLQANPDKNSEPAVQHRLATRQEVLEGLFEVAGVPGVGDVAGKAGVGHQQVDLALRVVRNDPPDEPEVPGIHADDAVKAVVIGRRDLAGAFAGVEPHAVLAETAFGRRIDGIAYLLSRYCGRLHIETVVNAPFADKVLEDELCHG